MRQASEVPRLGGEGPLRCGLVASEFQRVQCMVSIVPACCQSMIPVGLGVPAEGVAGRKSNFCRAPHVMYSRHVGPRLSPRCTLHNTHSHAHHQPVLVHIIAHIMFLSRLLAAARVQQALAPLARRQSAVTLSLLATPTSSALTPTH